MAFLFGLQDTLLDFFEKGGGVVVFIGFLIILMWSFILERFWYFKYIHGDVEKDIQNAWQETPDHKSWSGHQIRSMLISVVAPLLGLFGTITGMINTFQAITLFGTGDPKTMANGISEALVTTMLGLMTAIPATFMAAIMANYAKNILTVLEEQSTGMVAAASEENKA